VADQEISARAVPESPRPTARPAAPAELPGLGGAPRLAAVPAPATRPDGLRPPARASRRDAPELRRAGRSAPADVRAAATRSGLGMERVALIGILDLARDRLALVRLPDGAVHRVSTGDSIAGWQVTRIGADTLRVRRRGQERVLPLVGIE
jgi:Tfp pilus assembly protein PilP